MVKTLFILIQKCICWKFIKMNCIFFYVYLIIWVHSEFRKIYFKTKIILLNKKTITLWQFQIIFKNIFILEIYTVDNFDALIGTS